MGEQTRWHPAALRELLTCKDCLRVFNENVALLIADDNGTLNDEQAAAVYEHLKEEHKQHVQ